jgi:hypothetical protein
VPLTAARDVAPPRASGLTAEDLVAERMDRQRQPAHAARTQAAVVLHGHLRSVLPEPGLSCPHSHTGSNGRPTIE